ncbi:MAG: hypothetical protein DRN81_02470 [Thermoproteota archaeon]|nr:MAG: hypothetical protein DRN81_02470 [Candidatus Korarchaeota archaeon]
MPRKYVDARLYVKDLESRGELLDTLKLVKGMGYSKVGLSVDLDDPTIDVSSTCEKVGIGFGLTCAIDMTLGNWYKKAAEMRKKVNYLAALPRNLDQCRKATKTELFDAVILPPIGTIVFDKVAAEQACTREMCVEVDLSYLLNIWRAGFEKIIGVLRLELSIARKSKVPIIVASGAKSIFQVRDPITSAAIASSILGLPKIYALNSISSFAEKLIEGG